MTAIEKDPNKSVSKSYRGRPQSSTAEKTSRASAQPELFLASLWANRYCIKTVTLVTDPELCLLKPTKLLPVLLVFVSI